MQRAKKTPIDFNECKQQINLETLANNLKQLLADKQVTTKILSEITGISIAAINNLKRGAGNPTIGTLSALASFFNVSLSSLLDLDSGANLQKQGMIVSLFDLRFANKRADENTSEKMLLERPKNINDDSLFGVVINNNSLLPLYEKGTVFIVSASRQLIDGDIILANIRGINSIKRFFMKNEKIYLKNLNLDDEIESHSKKDVATLGVVIQIIQRAT